MNPVHNRPKLSCDLVHSDARLESSQDEQEMIRLTERPGHPSPDVPWKTEPSEFPRKDANHSVLHLVQADRSTDHARIPTELGTPLIMTENDYGIRAIPILSLHECTPERRFHTEKLKEIPRDEARVDAVGVLPRV